MSSEHATLRVGIDVGGTNVDGVLLDPLADANAANRGIIAWHKSPTTTNPSDGIQNVMTALLTKANVDRSRIASVTIGTTHFINAVIEKDQNRLAPVAVIRLSGPFSRDVPPGIDWPTDLRSIICKYSACVDGGLEVDGTIIRDVNEEQVKTVCAEIAQLGIKSVVVNGVFSPSDLVQRQEERAGEWVRKYLPGADVVLSKQVANLGFIERENASILNASILPFARLTIHSFQHALRLLSLTCPVFLTQNDGTILQADMAAQLPIRTFSSGPTNSMCGAAFLVKGGMGAGAARDGKEEKENILVVDIGGTTSDCGMLLASGLPRQAAAITEIGGVRMNFSCPDVKSIGLGGGSIVRKPSSPSSKLTIGPDSVGHRIVQSALVFGGTTATATDYAVRAQGLTHIGDPGLLGASSEFTSINPGTGTESGDNSDSDAVGEFKKVMKKMLEGLIDRMKTNAEDVTVLLVGGGAVLVPADEGDGSIGSEEAKLKGASRVVRPEFAGVANAIGAAIARVSGTIDTMVSTADKSMQTLLDEICALAVDKAVENGAVRETVKIAEMDAIPLQYVANKSRVIVKAIGDFDFSKPTSSLPPPSSSSSSSSSTTTTTTTTTTPSPSSNDVMDKKPLNLSDVAAEKVALDIPAYRPFVNGKREWVVSEVDLEWISVGCYILGTGGGGTPYPHFIRLREMMRKGAVVRVISPEDVKDDDVVACGGGKGSPTVGIEKLPANEMVEAQKLVYDMLGYKPDSVIALEIGGGNGLQGMLLGASNNMNIPTVDGDWMGRAYPVSWQITPVVLGGDQAHFVPTAIADGNGIGPLYSLLPCDSLIPNQKPICRQYKMLEARVKQASVLKKLLDAIKELVTDGNLDCTDEGIALQAMDNSHVALVSLKLVAEQFESYRCDRNMPLGVNLTSLTKILKCAKDNDVVTLKAADDADSLGMVFESPKEDRVGEYEMKLMDIDQEHLGIPDTNYDATITMSSAEFQRICRDLAALGESVKIEASKEGVRFSSEGEVGNGSVLLKQSAGQDRGGGSKKKEVKRDPDEDEEEEEEEKPEVDEEGEDEQEEDENPKKRKTTNGKAKTTKKAKTSSDGDEPGVSIILEKQVSLTFSLKYLSNFAKSAPLAKEVSLNMSNDVPLLVQFDFEQGTLQFFLAPKISDE